MRSKSSNSLYQLEIIEVNKHAEIPENPQFVGYLFFSLLPVRLHFIIKRKKSYIARQAVEIKVSALL